MEEMKNIIEQLKKENEILRCYMEEQEYEKSQQEQGQEQQSSFVSFRFVFHFISFRFVSLCHTNKTN